MTNFRKIRKKEIKIKIKTAKIPITVSIQSAYTKGWGYNGYGEREVSAFSEALDGEVILNFYPNGKIKTIYIFGTPYHEDDRSYTFNGDGEIIGHYWYDSGAEWDNTYASTEDAIDDMYVGYRTLKWFRAYIKTGAGLITGTPYEEYLRLTKNLRRKNKI